MGCTVFPNAPLAALKGVYWGVQTLDNGTFGGYIHLILPKGGFKPPFTKPANNSYKAGNYSSKKHFFPLIYNILSNKYALYGH